MRVSHMEARTLVLIKGATSSSLQTADELQVEAKQTEGDSRVSSGCRNEGDH